MKRLIPLFLICAAGAAAFYFLRKPAEDPSRIKLSGNLEITEVNAAFKTPGRVREILVKEGVGTLEEGCLSVPGIFDEVVRAANIRVRALDRHGNVFERDCDDILAICVQHEMDHLDGRLFVDYLSDLKRERIRKKLDKDRKEKASKASASVARAY